ncbi:MAG TPA: VCBS repeat-containing protein [Vicinamibacterales bacterium]|jgi:hypothetical protein
MTRGTRRLSVIAILLAAIASIAMPAAAADIRGTFTYQDTRGPMPLRRCYVEVWYHGTGLFDVWHVVGARTTDSSGHISYVDGTSSGTFSLRVYALNDAAIVRQTDYPAASFYVATTQLVPSSGASILDFSSAFTDEYTSRHFNLANAAQYAFEYASARRDPRDSELIPQVNILPTSLNFDGATFFNSTTNTIQIRVVQAFEDLVLVHEYGHHLQHDISRAAGSWGFHDGCEFRAWDGGLVNSPELAWTEGFAQYFAMAVARSNALNPSFDARPAAGSWTFAAAETPAACSVIGQPGASGTITAAMVESRVEAVLWDLLDGYGNPAQGFETFDRVSGEELTTFQIFDHEFGLASTSNIFTFRDAWRARGKDAAALDCIMSAYGMLPTTPGCTGSGATRLVGRFNGDNRSDIALTGAPDWGAVPVALSNGDGSFTVVNQGLAVFPSLASGPGVAKIAADFNGDGFTDIALVGGQGWGSIPVALSDGNGGFTMVNNVDLSMFPMFAADAGTQKLAGDFDGDGREDIALVGVATWGVIPVAFSDGMGGFTETAEAVTDFFQLRASVIGTRAFVGDFDGDGLSDIILIQPGSSSLPWARSLGNGSFEVRYINVGDFGVWSATPGAEILVGDFNGDHITDLALSGPTGWTTLPMVLSTGGGGFTTVNPPAGDFATWSSTMGVVRLVGDFSGNGTADIALAGVPGWTTLPEALTNGSAITVANSGVGSFQVWSATTGAQALVGDFNGDGRQDIALTGAAGWNTLPIAFASTTRTLGPRGLSINPNSFTVTNTMIGDFAIWASMW